KLAAGHYYLAMDLGQLARTKSIGALRIVEEMEKEFKIARLLDEKFDYGGSDRSLGMLYRDVPGWPTSIGSRAKARLHLQKAVELSPEYPGNHLELASAQRQFGDKRELQKSVEILRELLPAARSKFTGEDWAAAWLDWNQMWRDIEPAAEKQRQDK
ncbi:MAG TPA: hypothetical protein VHH73_20100, partial [Verrucomicrobiae bacterium]|nr:hypothetical protein [Verrucomicrobiae bacterium]